jgi:hypothetical protein
MTRCKHLLVIALLGTSLSASAQSGREGSIYSRFGLGEIQSFYGSKRQALGGGGIAYSSTTFVNLTNPASLSDQILMRLSTGIRFEGVEMSDAADRQSRLSSSNFDGLSIGVPLKSRKVGVAIGFTPVTRVGYLIDVSTPLDFGPSLDAGDQFAARYEGNGGLDRISFGIGYRVNSRLSVGFRADYIFGIIDDIQQTVFADARFEDTILINSTRLRGPSGAFGIRFSSPSLLRDGDFFNVGITFDLPYSLDGKRVRTEGTGLQTDTLGTEALGSAKLPWSIGLGTLYQPSPKLSWSLDAVYEPWSDFSSTYAFPGYDPLGTSNFSNRSKLSTGLEYFPAGRDLFAPYLKRILYRVGIFRETGYVSPVASKRLNTVGASAGLSIPTRSAGTRIDINIEVGTRGSATENLVRDRFLRIGVHFNFAERWFSRRQLG